jgi:hypothetical protein
MARYSGRRNRMSKLSGAEFESLSPLTSFRMTRRTLKEYEKAAKKKHEALHTLCAPVQHGGAGLPEENFSGSRLQPV